MIQAFQIDDICGRLQNADVMHVAKCFEGLSAKDVRRPEGAVELLIGMKHANMHPKLVEELDGWKAFLGQEKYSGDVID